MVMLLAIGLFVSASKAETLDEVQVADLYAQAKTAGAQEQSGAPAGGPAGETEDSGKGKKGKDQSKKDEGEVIDADFEMVDEEKK